MKEKITEKGGLLIYDGNCRFCVTSKRLLQQWDTKQSIRFTPAPTKISEIWFVNSNGVAVSGVVALRALLPFLPMGKMIAFLFLLPGVNRFAVWVYRILAKNRYRWFGSISKKRSF